MRTLPGFLLRLYCGECWRNLVPRFPLLGYEALDFRFAPLYREPSRRTCGALRARPSHQGNQYRFALAPEYQSRPGDVVSGDSALKTGGNSRAELEFPDLTITRVGSNALFRFLAGRREITLGWRHPVILLSGRRRRRKGSGWSDHRRGHGNGFSNFENPGKDQGNLPHRQGPRLFHGKSQAASRAEARADGRYPGRRHQNASRRDD